MREIFSVNLGTRVAKKCSVVKQKSKSVDVLGRVKGGWNGGRSGTWRFIVRRLAHKIEPRSTGVERLGLKVAAIFYIQRSSTQNTGRALMHECHTLPLLTFLMLTVSLPFICEV